MSGRGRGRGRGRGPILPKVTDDEGNVVPPSELGPPPLFPVSLCTYFGCKTVELHSTLIMLYNTLRPAESGATSSARDRGSRSKADGEMERMESELYQVSLPPESSAKR